MEAKPTAKRSPAPLIFALLTLWLLGLALVRPLSVDESQYVAATALIARGLLPYRDFAYLQTPLQPFLFAPLHWLLADHLLLAMRVTNALLGSITIVLVHKTARRLGASARPAVLAAALLVTCQSFSWCAGVARNDMLPAALMMIGLWLIAGGPGRGRQFAAGAVLGLAASTKISYAVPAAAVFLGGLSTGDSSERRGALLFAVGVTVGLLPTLLIAALAPQAFLFETIAFPATAPAQYYTEIGKAWRLGPWRFVQLIEAAATGPALIAAVEVARRSWKERWLADSRRRAMLAAAIGGLVSAGINKPFQIFYLLPALPPLFVLAALPLGGARVRPWWLKSTWPIFVVAGLVPATVWFTRASQDGAPALRAERNSQALAAPLRDRRVQGAIATLAGQYVASVDPRFAAGPFLYRTRGMVSTKQAREWHIVTQDQDELLAEGPPAAFVTGNYPDAEPAQEMELAAQAQALGYRPAATAAGFTIWTRQP